MGARAVNKPFKDESGVDHSAQKIADEILDYFLSEPETITITNTYKFQEIVLEIATISKELSQRDMLEKGIQRKKEIWNMIYKEPKRELERIAAIPIQIPIQKTD